MPGTREGLSLTEWKKKLDSVSARFFYYMNMVCARVTPTLILLCLFFTLRGHIIPLLGVYLATFDVQDVTATYMYTFEQDGYGDILVTCVFARGTRARGCIVVFRNGPTMRNITIMRSDEHGQTEASSVLYHLPDGEYEVIAYDLEFDDGTVDMNCEHAQRVFMFPPPTVPSLMPSTIPPTVSKSHYHQLPRL